MGKMFGRISAVVALVLLASTLLTALVSADGSNRKIVVFEAGLSQAAKEDIIRQAGGSIVKPVRLINGYAVMASPQAENALRVPGVVRVEDDTVFKATGKSPGAPQPAQQIGWGASRISAPAAWTYSRGVNVKVGVIDTGISKSHPDLTVWDGINTINAKKSYNDDNGHGSHVAGIIGAKDDAYGVVGVAPDAQLYAIKVLAANGSGYASDIVEGLDWAISRGMNIVNLSLGSDYYNQSIHEAILRTYAAGVTIVAAAGNDGPGDNTVDYPARFPEVIAVSASDQSNAIAGFSSRGPEVDLIAPGVSILSTYKGTGYATASGTSMAAPHVAGVAALRMAIDADKSPAHIASVLFSSADSLGLALGEQGSGLVNALAAVTAP